MSERSLVKKLAEVMRQVQYIQKRGFNKFHNYSYATEADVSEKVREVLAGQSVILIPNMTSHSVIEKQNQRGNTEYIVTVDMEFTFHDGDSGETLTYRMSGQGQDPGDKGIYKAMTGAQKYALMKVFMIPTGDDPEQDESVDLRNNEKLDKPNPKRKEKVQLLYKTAKGLGFGIEEIVNHAKVVFKRGITTVDDMTDAEITALTMQYNKKIDQQKTGA